MVYMFTTGIRIYDTQTGLRAFDHTLLAELLAIPGERYEYEMNVLLVCSRNKISMREIGIETIYINDNASSYFQPFKDSCRIYKEILKFSVSSLISFFLNYGIYSLLLWFTGGFSKSISLFLSNAMARILSGCFNYQVNRNLVFQEKAGSGRTAVQYVLLVAGILAVTVGCMVCGILEIYGTTNHLVNIYFIVGGMFLVIGNFMYLLQKN